MFAEIDQHLLFLFNRTWTNPALDWTMVMASSAAVWSPFLILGAGLVLIFGDFRLRVFVLCAGLTIGMVDGVTTKFLKDAVGRPRPRDARNDVRTLDLAKGSPRVLAIGKPLKVKMSRASKKPVAGNSFPSGHVANNFAVATLAVLFFRWKGAWVFLLAALVGYSRIYTGAHYPSDVAVTIFLAVGETLLLFAIYSWVWKKWGPRWMPKTAEAHPVLA